MGQIVREEQRDPPLVAIFWDRNASIEASTRSGPGWATLNQQISLLWFADLRPSHIAYRATSPAGWRLSRSPGITASPLQPSAQAITDIQE